MMDVVDTGMIGVSGSAHFPIGGRWKCWKIFDVSVEDAVGMQRWRARSEQEDLLVGDWCEPVFDFEEWLEYLFSGSRQFFRQTKP